MVNRDAVNFKEIGLNLKAVREELKLTMDAICKEIVISRSYLSDFERGYRRPTSKYLHYLHDRHNVNLNYIFSGEGRKFRPRPDEAQPNFGRFQEDVDDLLHLMDEVPPALYAVMGFISEYKMVNKSLIERYRKESVEQIGKTA